jgi:Zinc binding domain
VSKCCQTLKGEACSLRADKPGVCPGCGKKGKPVATLTVKSLVRDHTRVPASASYSFCRTPGCDVVYFAGQAVLNKPDIKVRVGIKETADPIPLCYCFDYTREDVRCDVDNGKNTAIPEKIKAEVQGGFCACEVKNPSGTCCLGDITRAIQKFKKDVPQTVAAPTGDPAKDQF